MNRTILACCATAFVCFAVTSTTGLATTFHQLATGPHQITAPPQTTVHFTGGVDLLCVNELPSGAPQHLNQQGVACTSDASPYLHVALWITKSRITFTRPAYVHTIYSASRR